jgi:hypothetical protein
MMRHLAPLSSEGKTPGSFVDQPLPWLLLLVLLLL